MNFWMNVGHVVAAWYATMWCGALLDDNDNDDLMDAIAERESSLLATCAHRSV